MISIPEPQFCRQTLTCYIMWYAWQVYAADYRNVTVEDSVIRESVLARKWTLNVRLHVGIARAFLVQTLPYLPALSIKKEIQLPHHQTNQDNQTKLLLLSHLTWNNCLFILAERVDNNSSGAVYVHDLKIIEIMG